MHTVALLGCDADLKGISGTFSLHRLFETSDDLSLSVDVGKRLTPLGGIDDILVVISESVVKNDNGAGGDFHRKEKFGCG